MSILEVRNPSDGSLIRSLTMTSPEEIPAIFAQAKEAQRIWAAVPLRKRSKYLLNLREVLLSRMDEIVDLICRENGKPAVEAIINDVLPVVEELTYFARKSPKLLSDQRITLSNPLVFHRKSRLSYYPLGTVLVISPWNFPFFLPFGEIAMALAAGNAVIFKPSEVTPLIGLKIQELVEEAGFPPNLLQTLIGDGQIGAAAIEAKPDKVFFTGSISTGKKIASACAKNLTPYVLELGGKDPMIIMADADLDFASSAALWGGFCNSGQMCASTERLIVHESIAEPFIGLLKQKISALQQSNNKDDRRDLGVITFDKQKSVYEEQIREAHSLRLQILTGGEFSADQRSFKPTLVTGENIERSKIYQDETFGPVIAVTTFKSTAEAIKKANDTQYGLCAAIISKNLNLADQIAQQLHAGTVTINEVAFTAGLPETPWGGVKSSGIGRKHSDHGLLEFVQTRHINRPRFSAYSSVKSFWWFPYTSLQFETFKRLLLIYRRSLFAKCTAIPEFLFHLLTFIKTDKRL